MTLCLRGAAENGKFSAIASDGMLSYGSTRGEVDAPKYQWYGDWLFMFAGLLGSTELILEEVRQILATEPDAFSRNNVQKTVRRAFNQRVANWSAIRNLSMFGMGMKEFTVRGPSAFSPEIYKRLAAAIYKDAKLNFSDEIMVIGWGKTPRSVMLYVIDKYGDGSHSKDGHCAIGIEIARDKAMRTLLKLEHGLRSSLQTTIYSVLAAKFSAEGKWVGTKTDLWLLRQRTSNDDPDKPVAIPVAEEKIDAIREIWQTRRNQ